MNTLKIFYFKNSNMCQDTALTLAAAKNNTKIVQLLLENPKINVNSIYIFNLLFIYSTQERSIFKCNIS